MPVGAAKIADMYQEQKRFTNTLNRIHKRKPFIYNNSWAFGKNINSILYIYKLSCNQLTATM